MKKAIIIALATVTLSLFTTACGESEADKLAKQEMKAKTERAAILEKYRKIAADVRKEFKTFQERANAFDERCKVEKMPTAEERKNLLTYPDFASEVKLIVLSLM